MQIIIEIFEFFALILAVIGALIIIWSALASAFHYIHDLLRVKDGKSSIDHIRLEFGRSIVLSLEFFIAADLIQTVIVPDYYEIGLLGALVVIRTVLSVFLNKELRQLSQTERNRLR